ncbi:MAG: nucleotidyl transferase AbiEii/AbiGii toxin family protein [Aestuariivita sp.]|nr:nucleotidyl transferase AbiEii/AbiGii toxin family protein [Aestuariivita sp.]MCY4202611.1 nucleotidyl transferase AbiEii/AbiGii toxin family protein [Aestuariivita sp.]
MNSEETFFELSNKAKIDLLRAATLRIPAGLLEKNIWVVWALDTLFDSPIGDKLVFKGGTSLSKAYRAIDRFSEDVDITYDIRAIIPDLVNDPKIPTRQAAHRRGSGPKSSRSVSWNGLRQNPFRF